ncbi:ABC transporter permease [Arthrospiribacter ruber]|uniref:Ribose ABC transporter permease n=1 Tax=Arthrospiribacter ruber TaxID=2487934 RepID=A0A951ISL9_9BACT|nr:ribose ABC transporter permease [Arthrospiribacter ruber]MBW3467000.1 ribose ABC transporter permease [Arthrospiribacter ruber]
MEKSTSIRNYRDILIKFQSLLALVILCFVLAMMTDIFFTSSNMLNVMRQISVNICISVGMTLVILTGGIDLSVGSILALSGALTAGFLKFGLELPFFDTFIGFTIFGAVLIGILSGTALGTFNGLAITVFRVPPFVATLAMLTIARGFTMLYTKGFPISGLGQNYAFIGTGWLLGIPVPVWIALTVVAIAFFVTNKTRLGRYIYAIGGNESAAQLSGINIRKIKTIVYAIAGGLAALGGIIVTSRLDSAQPNAGASYELDAIAAVVIGGTSLSGGKGTIGGTVLGAIIIGVLNNGLVLLNVSPFWQQVIKGFVILLAIIIDKSNTRK